jgi:hypothetical protein
MIFALSNAFPWPELIAALTHDNIPRNSGLAAIKLHAEATTS